MIVLGTTLANLSGSKERKGRKGRKHQRFRWRPAPPRPSKTVGEAGFPRAFTATTGKTTTAVFFALRGFLFLLRIATRPQVFCTSETLDK